MSCERVGDHGDDVMTIKDGDGYEDDDKEVYIDEYKEDDDVVYQEQ